MVRNIGKVPEEILNIVLNMEKKYNTQHHKFNSIKEVKKYLKQEEILRLNQIKNEHNYSQDQKTISATSNVIVKINPSSNIYRLEITKLKQPLLLYTY
ncbi:MAG: hypothetical protein KTV77_02955 [Wolbachia endosymbiont of Fragariocoptes setiger]|nr:hypothetical protein [Wolbachia endosymbiont of Fragariocoptes setiger]